MKKLRWLGFLLTAAMAVAGCGDSFDSGPAGAAATDIPNPSSAIMFSDALKAKVIAATADGECTPDIEPGDCWLPAYVGSENPPGADQVLNLSEADASPCRTPGINDAPSDSQRECWPQPPGAGYEGDTILVVCKAYDSRQQLRFGFVVPFDQVRNKDLGDRQQAVAADDVIGVIGQNHARYIEFISTPKRSTAELAIISQLAPCPY